MQLSASSINPNKNASICQCPIKSQLSQEDASKKNKNKSILKKSINRVPLLINYSFVFKISESFIVNERALKQYQGFSESFMTSVFYFKSIQTLTINPFYVSLGLKQTLNNQFPLSYYTERFRSFGDLEFYELANTLEMLDLQLSSRIQKIQTQFERQQTKQTMKNQLETLLQSKKGKKIICFYSEPSETHFTMNRIIISTQLLTELGYSPQEISSEFLKYRHVFFEIFDSSFYRQIVKNASLRLTRQNTGETSVQKEEVFLDYIIRVSSDEKGNFEEKIKAQIKFSRPFSNISLYEIEQIDSNTIIERTPRKSVKNEPVIRQWEQKLMSSQIAILKTLNYQNPQAQKISQQ